MTGMTRALTAVSAIALMSTPALAQAVQESVQQDEASTAGFEDIVVTAQRRAESLQRAPVAVDVIGGDSILEANITQVANLQEHVPSLIIEAAPAGNLVFIRGIGNFTLTNNAEPATAFNFDDVYIARPAAMDSHFFDLQRVEVLKGPQGTLYGRNATAGAINVIPEKPALGEFSGYGSFAIGNYARRYLEGAVNIPIGSSVALRASGRHLKRDGYLRDGTADDDTSSVRLQALGELTPNLRVRASFDYTRQGGAGSGLSFYTNAPFDPATMSYVSTPVPLDVEEGMYSDAIGAYIRTITYPSLGAALEPLQIYPFRNNHYYGAHANIEWQSSVGTFALIPAWRNDQLDFASATGFNTYTNVDVEQNSLEARFVSERLSIFDITAGGMLYDEAIDLLVSASLGGAGLFQDVQYQTKSHAAYLRATAHLSDALRFTGGLRYTHDKKSIQEATTNLTLICTRVAGDMRDCPTVPLIPFTKTLQEQPNLPPAGSLPVPLGDSGALLIRSDPTQDATSRNGEITYRVAVEYDLAPQSLAYASVETGYRSGGFNPSGSAPFDPEYITAYTVGIKNQFFHNRVRLNVEGFVWKYRNQQLSFIGLDLNGAPANMTRNIGKLTAKGIEAEFSALVTNTTVLTANILYLDSKYDEFIYLTPTVAGYPNTGCAVSIHPTNPAAYVADCTGKTAFNSPKWTASLSVEQTIPLGDHELMLQADTLYRSSHFFFINYTPDQLVDGRWQSNAQISFGPVDKSWNLALYVRNIENSREPQFGTQTPFTTLTTVLTSAPRTYGARVSVRF